MSENNNTSPSRSKQEVQIAKDFQKVFRKRQEELQEHGGLEEDEVKLLKHLQTVESTYTGMAVSLLTFALLRGVRVQVRRRFTSRSTAPGFSTDGGKTYSPFQNAPQAAPTPVVPPEGPVARYFGVFLDATVGAMVGTIYDEYSVDRTSAKKEFVEHPLKAGRSNMAHQFCPLLIQEYQRHWNLGGKGSDSSSSTNSDNTFTQEGRLGTVTIQPTSPLDPQELLKSPETEHLQLWTTLINNCQQRQTMELRIRNELGIADSNQPVEIPPPGVVVENDKARRDEESFENTNSRENFGGEGLDTTDSQEWNQEDLSSFVSDQEEDSRR